jgi:hypothetical protein
MFAIWQQKCVTIHFPRAFDNSHPKGVTKITLRNRYGL